MQGWNSLCEEGRELTRVRGLPSTFRGQLQLESLNCKSANLWGSIPAAPSSMAVGMEKTNEQLVVTVLHDKGKKVSKLLV